MLVIRIQRGRSNIRQGGAMCRPPAAPAAAALALLPPPLLRDSQWSFQGSVWMADAGSYWTSRGFVFWRSPLFTCWKGLTAEEGCIGRRSRAAHRLSPYLGHAFNGLCFFQVKNSYSSEPREAADILLLTKMATYIVQPDSQRFYLREIETVEIIAIPSSFVGVQNSLMII